MCLCVCVCTKSCVRGGVCSWMYPYMWRPQDDRQCSPSVGINLCFWDIIFLLVLNSLVMFDWLIDSSKWSSCLYSLKTDITSIGIIKQLTQNWKILDRKSFKSQKVRKGVSLRLRKERAQTSQNVPENYNVYTVLLPRKYKKSGVLRRGNTLTRLTAWKCTELQTFSVHILSGLLGSAFSDAAVLVPQILWKELQ